MSFAFDTLAYSKRLRDAGVEQQQAEAMAEALRHSLAAGELAPKRNLDLKELEQRLLLRLGAFMIAVAGGALAIAQLLPPGAHLR
jgi:hypothetical protein